MSVINRIKKLEKLLIKKVIDVKMSHYRPKLTRLEWLEKIELSMSGIDDIEASKIVLRKRDDYGLSANSPYWEVLRKYWSENS